MKRLNRNLMIIFLCLIISAILFPKNTLASSVPSTPTNLTATAASSIQINLNWDSTSGATSYYLYMSTSYYGTYNNIAVLTSPNYANTGLSTNGTYYYKVQAVNSYGSSGFSAIASATTTNTNTTYSVPSIPTNLTATAASSSQINLNWDAINGATSYYLYMATSYYGTYNNIAVLTSPNYANMGLSTNGTYYYKVQAVNSYGSSDFSAISSATTTNTNTTYSVPAIPTNLTATAASSSQINLNWDSMSGATSYYLYRATSSSGTYANIVTVTTAGYIDTVLSSGSTYYYKVQAVNSAGTSSYSPEVFATTTSDGTTSPPDSSSQIQSSRLAGQDRYGTAAEISKSWWKAPYYAIIASGDSFPDALCGAPLATKYNAPILLSSKDNLAEQTKLQLSSLKVKQVFIIGGVGVISTNVEQEIRNMGIVVTRLAGNDRYATSLKVAQAMGKFNQAVIATGEDFPDALSIAPIAALKGIPIILTPKDNLPTGLKDYLSKTVQSTYVVGGVGVVSDYVLNQLPSPMRLSGIDRYETNLSIIKEFSSELNFENCYIATGEDFPDALAGSALAASTSSPIILVSDPVEPSTQDFINSKTGSISKIIVFGGIGAVPDSILNSLNAPSNGSNTPSTPTNITASTVSSSQIKLTWDAVSGATSYYVYGATSSSGTYNKIATVTTSSYTNTGLWAGTTYYYKVQAVNGVGSSSYSTVTYATTTASNS
ncbi:MAG: cell wall-binding repeat-containing protein [Desulfosporosinus sp.]|nr:cell wall-binding repeat-containing protein [Desulfosporosinus sp.]